MADAFGTSASIYEGVWTDWSRGKVWGLTWTLCPTQATLLTNALAVFVTISGIRLWTIIRFILYELSASERQGMSPHLRKRQVILRNAGSDLATAWLMLNLACSSRRRHTNRRRWSTYGIGLFAITYTVLFWIAGVFSNKAISATKDGRSAVLARSKRCGVWNETYRAIAQDSLFSNEFEYGLFVQNAAKQRHDIQLSLGYAQECYLSQAFADGMSPTCNTLKTSRLNWTVWDSTCPFAPHLCHKDSKVIVLDTGLIDSHEDLGINASPGDRLKYQRRTTCAVLDDSGYIRGWDGSITNSSSPKPAPDAAFAYYGPSLYKEGNWTYSYSNFASFYNDFSAQVTLPYQIDVEMAYAVADPQYSFGDFEPIPELVQAKADLNMFFLSFTGMYLDPIEDPWFSAHREAHFPNPNVFLQSRFSRDAAISSLGCTEQHRFCSGNSSCTEFGGFDQVQNNGTFNAGLSPHQNVTFDRILRAVTYSGLRNVVMQLETTTTPMLATNVSMSGQSGAVVSPGLPDNQWTLEVGFWHSIAMAQLQREVVQWATGQIAPEPQYSQYLLPPTEEPDKWFCKSFMIQSIVYQSFSLLAIILIVIFGTLAIVISLTIEDIAALLRKCFRKSPPPRSWDHFDMLGDRTPVIPRFQPDERLSRTTSRRHNPNRGLELKTRFSTPEINRMSSPTLPPDDRTISIWNAHANSSHLSPPKTGEAPPRPARESWMAISLNEFEFTTPDTAIPTLRSERQRRMARPIASPPPVVAPPYARRFERDTAVNYDTWV
ncbi:hypothetical protein A1O7_03620 [Cladophialophora yegresii CBS 114405]|uniref:Uncharacterized protein n=1 Tax=Cladophialophora yegresii CBS 114405 TaxID=1182544 RepID=W9WY29_9EURO|nr:uncharacterized protein A1O7_03620 [Cladophialophora yegresii CBS 114405]EXJ63174.1 hypothetical protein A1O7_03620 [Cladophialophora yegresii CBS 114405]